MAIDRLVLEAGTDGYLLEDSSGIVILELPPNLGYRNLILSEPGLVAYWRLDEDVGTYADSKGTNSGTVVGNVTRGVAGALAADPNRAATFDGVTGYVQVPDDNAFSIGTTGVLTVECWAKPNAASPDGYLVAKSGNGNNYEWGLYATNGWGMTVWNLAGAGAANGSQLTYTAGWHHVVAIFDSVNQRLREYIDGVGPLDDADAWTNLPIGNSTGLVNIGRRPDGVSPFAGMVDEVAIYSNELSADQAKAHYEYGQGRFFIPYTQNMLPLIAQ